MPDREKLVAAAKRLHAYLEHHHYKEGLLSGPDAGVRFNLRLWRFLKDKLEFIPWPDDYVFMQSQGYWVLANWLLHEATGERHYRDIAVESTEATLGLETPEGFWRYPLPERKHLIATLEGVWGGAALLATYEREPHREFLDGAIRAYDFIVNHIGFQDHPQGEAINYFDRPRGKVPNNTVIAAWYFLRLWSATGDDRFLEHVDGMISFVEAVQLPTGEIPYIVESPYEKRRDHYLCFQYNAYEFLHLAWMNKLSQDDRKDSIMTRLAGFLETGVRPSGVCARNCANAQGGGPEVPYYTAALGAALVEAARQGFIASSDLSERCYSRFLSQQREDGSFDYSLGDYGFLSDRRSYPRPMVMTLFHLLIG